MLAAPVAGDQRDLLRVRLVKRRIIQNQKTHLLTYQGGHLFPQRRRIGRLSLQQAHERIVRHKIGTATGCLAAAVHLLGGDQKLEVIDLIDTRRTHAK